MYVCTKLIVGTIDDKHLCTFFFVWKHSPKLIFHFRNLKNQIVFENNFAMVIDVIVFFSLVEANSQLEITSICYVFLRFIGSLSSYRTCKKKQKLILSPSLRNTYLPKRKGVMPDNIINYFWYIWSLSGCHRLIITSWGCSMMYSMLSCSSQCLQKFQLSLH